MPRKLLGRVGKMVRRVGNMIGAWGRNWGAWGRCLEGGEDAGERWKVAGTEGK